MFQCFWFVGKEPISLLEVSLLTHDPLAILFRSCLIFSSAEEPNLQIQRFPQTPPSANTEDKQPLLKKSAAWPDSAPIKSLPVG